MFCFMSAPKDPVGNWSLATRFFSCISLLENGPNAMLNRLTVVASKSLRYVTEQIPFRLRALKRCILALKSYGTHTICCINKSSVRSLSMLTSSGRCDIRLLPVWDNLHSCPYTPSSTQQKSEKDTNLQETIINCLLAHNCFISSYNVYKSAKMPITWNDQANTKV